MNKTEEFNEWEAKMSAYQFALSLIGIDANDRPPREGEGYRNQKRSILSGEMFDLANDEHMYEVIKDLASDPDSDAVTHRKALLYLKQIEKTRFVPRDAYLDYQMILAESEQAWLKYKKTSDYSAYAPYLARLVEKEKELVSYRKTGKTVYDTLLDDNETGWNMERYDAFFNQLKEALLPLIRDISAHPYTDTAFLHLYYPAEEQRKFMKQITDYVGFTSAWGKIGESEHPLTSWIAEGDVRITTKYREHDVAAAILSTVHETGHAWYVHDVDPAYDGTILLTSINAGIHESQSRFCENHLGRSRAFWEYNYPGLQKCFPKQLGSVSLDRFIKAVNAPAPTLVRTESDELTYPIHIIIRYEIEKEMFNGQVDYAHLDELWNQKYKEYLGLDVPDSTVGILQDMHWPYAFFGYFPTYALGSAFAAQFYHKMRETVDADELLRTNQYPEVIAWLKEHVHRYGNFYDPDQVVEMATGEPFDPKYYIDYLQKKYGNYR